MIRQLDAADWYLLRDTRLAALKDSPRAFGATYADELALTSDEWRARIEKSPWFVAIDHDEVAGVITSMFGRCAQPEIIAMWVKPEFRGSNVAKDLVRALIAYWKKEGHTHLVLSVAEDNIRAISFYKRLGFVFTGTKEPLRSDPNRDIHQMILATNELRLP